MVEPIPNQVHQQTVPPAALFDQLINDEISSSSSSSSSVKSRFQIKRSAVFWMTVSIGPILLSFVMGILLAPVQQRQSPVAFLEAWREKRKTLPPRELKFYDSFIQSMRNDHPATVRSASLVLPSRMEGRLATAIIEDGQGILQPPDADTMRTAKSRRPISRGKNRRDDEAALYEALVHPILLAHDNPKHVAILVDNSSSSSSSSMHLVLQEVLKHQTVERIIVFHVDESLPLHRFDKNFRVHIEARRVPISNLDRYLQEQDVDFDAIIFARYGIMFSLSLSLICRCCLISAHLHACN